MTFASSTSWATFKRNVLSTPPEYATARLPIRLMLSFKFSSFARGSMFTVPVKLLSDILGQQAVVDRFDTDPFFFGKTFRVFIFKLPFDSLAPEIGVLDGEDAVFRLHRRDIPSQDEFFNLVHPQAER